jgi:hypothetical protein
MIRYRAVIEFEDSNFADAYEQIYRDGYEIKSLGEVKVVQAFEGSE